MKLKDENEKKETPKKKIKLPPMNNNGKNNLKTLSIWLMIILVALYLTQVLLPGMDDEVKITYSEFRRQLEKNNVEKVELIGNLCEGDCKKGPNIRIGDQIYHDVAPNSLKDILIHHFPECDYEL